MHWTTVFFLFGALFGGLFAIWVGGGVLSLDPSFRRPPIALFVIPHAVIGALIGLALVPTDLTPLLTSLWRGMAWGYTGPAIAIVITWCLTELTQLLCKPPQA